MMTVHRLPVYHEKGGGSSEVIGVTGDMVFSLSKRKGLVIKPYTLPPMEDDTETQQKGVNNASGDTATKVSLEF